MSSRPAQIYTDSLLTCLNVSPQVSRALLPKPKMEVLEKAQIEREFELVSARLKLTKRSRDVFMEICGVPWDDKLFGLVHIQGGPSGCRVGLGSL